MSTLSLLVGGCLGYFASPSTFYVKYAEEIENS